MRKTKAFETEINPKELEKVFDMFPEIVRKKKLQAKHKRRILKNFEAFSKDLAKRIKDP